MEPDAFRVFFVTVLMFWLWRTAITQTEDNTCNRLTIEPTFIRVTPAKTEAGHSVVLRCEYVCPISSGGTVPFIFRILKSLRGKMEGVVQIATGDTEPECSHLPESTEIKVNSSMAGTYFVEISFIKASCDDEAVYRCYTNVQDRSRSDTIISRNNVYLSVNGPVTLTLSPEGRSSWSAGEDVTMTCNGPAPKNVTHTKKWKIDIVWDFRDPGNDTWYPVDSSTVNLTEDTAPAFANNTGMYCGRTVSEMKNIRLREEDLGREFRCYMVVNGDGYLKYKASVTLGMISTEGGGDKGGGDKGGGDKVGGDKGGGDKGDDKQFQSKSDDHWSPILIGGMGAGGGLLLLGVGALACFLKRRRHQQLADTARQRPTSRDRDHGEVSHPTADNDLNEPDETAGSDVSGSSSDSTSEDPSTYSGTSDVAGN